MTDVQKTIKKLLTANQLEPFIKHIRFPQYKNLAPDTRIEFSHPITVLVGSNGTNKSSVLRALYGSPGQSNLGNLWFSTSMDPIEEGDGVRNCFIYGYFNAAAGKVTEVIKMRIKKENDPDYWEPARPYVKYGMEAVPKGQKTPGANATRWKTLEKEVIYIDFRSALSAFDKFFYYGELRNKPNSQKNKKELIRTRSPHLKRAVDQGLKSLFYRKSERILNEENRILSANEIKEISAILGRQYSEIRLIRHNFYNGDGYTAQLKSNDLRYTEAFAGSGEFSVVKLVTSVMNGAAKSLILLDEPEVSLHPGAQERLMKFLADQVKVKKHQIIISTHSPAMVRTLPPDAIKVLSMDNISGKVTVPRQSALPEEAFFHLGEPAPGKKIVVVEDKLAQAMVLKSLRPHGEAIFKLFDVIYFPGGAETLWGHYIPIFAAESRDNVIVLFDGDKLPDAPFPDPDTIPPADEGKVAEEIKRVTSVDVKFHVDGGINGGDVGQINLARRCFIKWARTYVSYLPCSTPEEFVWTRMTGDAKDDGNADKDYKVLFEALAKQELALAGFEDVKADEILQIQRQKLATIADDDPDLTNLRESLRSFVAGD